MANPSKKKGTRAETAVLRYLESRGMAVRRLPLSGSKDKGDLEIRDFHGNPITVEVKAGKMTASPTRAQLEEWIRQARTEAENAVGHHTEDWYLVVARYHRKLADADVWYKRGGRICHMYLDQLRVTPPFDSEK